MTTHWYPSHRADPRVVGLYQRHYSSRNKSRETWRTSGITGPGESMVLLTTACDALWAWVRCIRNDGQEGVNCAVFRNEGATRSSELIEEACTLAWDRWPNTRLFTYVNPSRIASANPGYCFKMAGFRQCGWNKDRTLVVLERLAA